MSILKICNVKYSYDGNKMVLKNISVEFEAGKIYAIVVRLGVGKRPCFLCLEDWTTHVTDR